MGVDGIFFGGEHFFKKYAKNIQKNFQKISQPQHSIFARLDEKRYLQEIFEKIFKKLQKNILRKLR